MESGMSSGKFHIENRIAEPRFTPKGRFSIARNLDECINCGKCAALCVYGVHGREELDYRKMAEPIDYLCRDCFMCTQGCPEQALTIGINPDFMARGDGLFKPEIVASLMEQSNRGSLPVFGAGYRGRFSGPGFDAMWTDMSEIVRPTRDGIHGREYISTAVDLGRKPMDLCGLEFDEKGDPLFNIPPTVEIKLPILFGRLRFSPADEAILSALAAAAVELGTFLVLDAERIDETLQASRHHLIPSLDPSLYSWSKMAEIARDEWFIELRNDRDLAGLVRGLKELKPDLIIMAELALDGKAAESEARAAELVESGVDILHLSLDPYAPGNVAGEPPGPGTVADALPLVHQGLVRRGIRDEVSIVVSGDIAMAEHVPKSIILGADAVAVDTPLLIALECTVCGDCKVDKPCPMELEKIGLRWGQARVVNLMASWQNQLLEILGAMGLREVSRLRGEMGRAIFKEDLDDELLSGLKRAGPAELASELASVGMSKPTAPRRVTSADEPVPGLLPVPRREMMERHWHRSMVQSVETEQQGGRPTIPPDTRELMTFPLALWRVTRGDDCIACGTCERACPTGVHLRKPGHNRMEPARAQLCMGSDCAEKEPSCVFQCPTESLTVEPNPEMEALGDARWPPRMIESSFRVAEGRQEILADFETGASGGGFDRIVFDRAIPTPASGAPEPEIDLSLPLNRRGEGPERTLSLPIYGGGMSYGSIGPEVMLARAMAARELDILTCTGEGGYPEFLEPYADWVITQVATGLFGVSEDSLRRSPMVEFKYAQGAKPGLGGHLLGEKVTPDVARMRQSVEERSLFSPFPFHSVYSVEDHKKHIDWILATNPDALISVKVSTPNDVDMVAVGSYYAGAHVLHIDGAYGGTGAAPEIAKKNIAMPIEYAIPKTHRFLANEGIRNEITLIASGGIRTASDMAKAIALGADGIVIGTSELIALECVRCGNCESFRGCPRGIATTDPYLVRFMDANWGKERILNIYRAYARGLRHILSQLGLKRIADLRGQTEYLRLTDQDPALQPDAVAEASRSAEEGQHVE